MIVIEVEVDGLVMVPVDDVPGKTLNRACFDARTRVHELLNRGEFGFSGRISGENFRCKAAPKSWQEERAELLTEVAALRKVLEELRAQYSEQLQFSADTAWAKAVRVIDVKMEQLAQRFVIPVKTVETDGSGE